MNLTAEERITKARAKIMRDERFTAISPVLMVGSWQVVDDMPTAATNGRDVFYGRKFIDECDDRLLRFVILHEYFHIMLMHMTTWAKLDKEDARLSNIAKDMVINNMLKAMDPNEQFLTIWENAYCDPQYDGLDTGGVYKRLKQQAQSEPQGGGGNGLKGQQFDYHQPAGGDGDDGDDRVEPLTEAEAEEVAKAVDTALRQGALIAGKTGAGIPRDIASLLDPVVPWEDVLREWLKTTAKGGDLSTWARPARRWLGHGLYLPSRYTEAVNRIVIGVDTSGSISGEELQRALTEIVSACEAICPQTVDVIYWDANVAAHEVYEGERVRDIAEATKPKGGGGTDVRSLFTYIDQRGLNPDAVVVFTDGYTPWPASLKHPTLWCISIKELHAPVGETLYVPA